MVQVIRSASAVTQVVACSNGASLDSRQRNALPTIRYMYYNSTISTSLNNRQTNFKGSLSTWLGWLLLRVCVCLRDVWTDDDNCDKRNCTGTENCYRYGISCPHGSCVRRSGIGDPKSAKSELFVTNECTPDKLKRHTHHRQIVQEKRFRAFFHRVRLTRSHVMINSYHHSQQRRPQPSSRLLPEPCTRRIFSLSYSHRDQMRFSGGRQTQVPSTVLILVAAGPRVQSGLRRHRWLLRSLQSLCQHRRQQQRQRSFPAQRTRLH